MRKHHQKQILDLLKTLGEAHAEIERLFSAGQMEGAIQWLLSCQNGAAHVAEFIEQLAGKGTKTVALLEEYGELLYQAGVEISENGTSQSEASFAIRLQEQLVEMESSVRNDLKPDKIEIAFLPYKVSMWDSMESVWRAANDDPDCDAHVIPIPYCHKQPDGTFGPMRCEIDQYPEDVPTIDWRKYNIEERHPDIIVIHSPYDDGNHVTSIHPYFYSKQLKEFTDLLVYIPYFVCLDDVPEHFCTCVGVLYADRVIVQSNKIRDTYIRVFKEIEKKNNREGGFGNLEEKFIALGSPKFDKVINTKREDCKIPETWLKLIEKPDGTRKKVILYNTSVSALLEGNEKVLHKLRYVFDFFGKRDDVVLLWRPHPMSVATYESMRPQLCEEYQEIVAEYRRQGFGIYDDTVDLHRAIAVSDAYYGDGSSSLVALYGATGKPIMIQDNKMFYDNLFFEYYVDFDGYYWTSSYYGNGLYRIDKSTWNAEFVGIFPEESLTSSILYPHAVACGGKIYFAPYRASAISVFDPATGAFERIVFKKVDEKTENCLQSKSMFLNHFFYAVAYGKYIYFIPQRYNAILRLDTETQEIEYINDWLPVLEKHVNYPMYGRFYGVFQIDETLYIAAHCASAVLELNLATGKTKVHIINDEKLHFTGICEYGEDLYLLTFTDLVIKYNPHTGKVSRIGTGDGVHEGKIQSDFRAILCVGGNLILVPYTYSGGLVKIDIATGKRESVPNLLSTISEGNGAIHYLFARASEDKLFAFSHARQRLEILDIASLQLLQGIEIPLDDKHMECIVKKVRDEEHSGHSTATADLLSCILYENSLSGLRMLLASTPNMLGENIRAQFFSQMSANMEGNAGEMIYKMLAQKLKCESL
jgi:hypothetical protein